MASMDFIGMAGDLWDLLIMTLLPILLIAIIVGYTWVCLKAARKTSDDFQEEVWRDARSK